MSPIPLPLPLFRLFHPCVTGSPTSLPPRRVLAPLWPVGFRLEREGGWEFGWENRATRVLTTRHRQLVEHRGDGLDCRDDNRNLTRYCVCGVKTTEMM